MYYFFEKVTPITDITALFCVDILPGITTSQERLRYVYVNVNPNAWCDSQIHTENRVHCNFLVKSK